MGNQQVTEDEWPAEGSTCWCRCEDEDEAIRIASNELHREEIDATESSASDGASSEEEVEVNSTYASQLQTFHDVAFEKLSQQMLMEGGSWAKGGGASSMLDGR
jgi:hypothetical protein